MSDEIKQKRYTVTVDAETAESFDVECRKIGFSRHTAIYLLMRDFLVQWMPLPFPVADTMNWRRIELNDLLFRVRHLQSIEQQRLDDLLFLDRSPIVEDTKRLMEGLGSIINEVHELIGSIKTQ